MSERGEPSVDWKFTNNHLVVITSSRKIKPLECKTYLLDNWKDLMVDGTRFLLLGGNHGRKSGKMGRFDKKAEYNLKRRIKEVIKIKRKERKERNIKIFYHRIKNYLDKDTRRPRPEDLVKSIDHHKPTILMLAFCYSSQSILFDTLRPGSHR